MAATGWADERVTRRTKIELAAMSAVASVAVTAGTVLFALNRQVRSDSFSSFRDLVEELVPAVAFFVTGLVLRARRPGNLVGGLSSAIGSLGLVSWMLAQYAWYGLVTHPGSLRGARAVEVGLQGSWTPELLVLVVLVCVFPHGRLLPGRWRLVPWASVTAFGMLYVFALTQAPSAPYQHVHNPLHVSARPLFLLVVAALPLAIGSVVGAVATVVARFRRAQPDEREQLKWLILAAFVLPVGLVAHSIADSVAPGADNTIELVFSFAVAAFPVAIGIAVLKYRLYEIDRIISRTLGYGASSALLAGAYVGMVVAGEDSFAPVSGGSSVAVALSTLVVAALFLPVRARVQRLVDRRFYRSKVDSEEMLARFGAQLRNEADLDTLLHEVSKTAREALQPAEVWLWLRPDEGASP